ncbi:uncharacterized protein LOC143245412 isoform X1 [Tachypleus tridentatus]|uniref:uncharacterized protein LOC143245412 isoform X1 n=1 Tax=Tachypleus tridentatus TaxID=6853 RepID=UPI003FD37D4B
MGCGPSKLYLSSRRRGSYSEDDGDEHCEMGENVFTPMGVSHLHPKYSRKMEANNQEITTTILNRNVKPELKDKGNRTLSGPLRAQVKRTPSQTEFFRVLDEKINLFLKFPFFVTFYHQGRGNNKHCTQEPSKC